MTFRSIEFDAIAPADAEGDFVLRRGKYFELGDYPDKEFSLNEAEADAALDSFERMPINLEHTHTLFDGKLGWVQRLWREGRDLLAEYAIPAWLQVVTGGEPIRISSEWDRETKRPIGAALVLSPRIEDAVMMTGTETGGGDNESGRVGDETGTGIVQGRDLKKEDRRVSLLSRFTAFLRGEGLLDEEEVQLQAGAGHAESSAPSEEITAPHSSLRFTNTPEFRQMSEMLKEQASVISALKAQFADELNKATSVSHMSAINDLVKQGRITSGEGEQWREVAAEHPAAFSAVLATLQARQPLPQFTERPVRRISPDPEEPAGKLIALSKERSAQTGERYDTAFSKVCRENPELAAAHAANAPRYGGGAHE
jgi:hypothetical protein